MRCCIVRWSTETLSLSGSGTRRLRAGSWRSVGGDVGGAAAVAGGGLRPLDVKVEELHLQKERTAVREGDSNHGKVAARAGRGTLLPVS